MPPTSVPLGPIAVTLKVVEPVMVNVPVTDPLTVQIWPTTLAPGVAEPAFVFGLAWYAGWLVWTFFADRTSRT